ncbi:copper homeostasis protein CutC [Nocardioides rotundus]|uniref:copper homeostasis protein CutC n=1 Tax=Nocardioides rotundus TaxID=1774216 RepID=UPI001CC16F59|nr:copper homeostasis protein CutC [Nocardioides rotundus]UAL30120.1 copper homeostasis protein CutC [Nocardioides rotundus]
MLLEVIVTGPEDAEAATAGGADRLELVGEPERGGMTPSASVVRSVLAATALPVRVMVRRQEAHVLGRPEIDDLVRDVDTLDAAELVCGAARPDGTPDIDALAPVVEAIAGRPWTFHRAIDSAPDLPTAVRDVLALPGCDQVLTAGDPAGVEAGVRRLRELLARAAVPVDAVLVGGGVTEENLGDVLAAGAHHVHVGRSVRREGAWSGAVLPELVARLAADLRGS